MRPVLRLRHNLGLKLLSVSLALLLWSFVHGSKVVHREVWLPVRYVHLPDSLMFLEDPPRKVRVEVSGPSQELSFRLRFLRDGALHLDLSDVRPPHHRLAPGISDVTMATGARIAVDRILEPTSIDLELDRRVEKILPVLLSVSGTVPDGYCLPSEPRVVPEEVRCTGAATVLKGLEQIQTTSVDLGRHKGSFKETVQLVHDPGLVICEPNEVSAEVQVDRLRSVALLETPVTILGPAESGVSVEVQPAKVSLTVSGPSTRIETLDSDDVSLVLDLRSLRPGRYTSLPLEPRLPAWVLLDSIEPPTVQVTIFKNRKRRSS